MKKKIIFVTKALWIGGIETALVNLLKYFDYDKCYFARFKGRVGYVGSDPTKMSGDDCGSGEDGYISEKIWIQQTVSSNRRNG